MTYTAIPNGDVDPDSPLTTGLVTLLRDNPIAIAAGDSGAPEIVGAALATGAVDTVSIAAAAVGRSEIANSTTTSAGSLSGITDFTLNDWALFPMIHNSGNSGDVAMAGAFADGGGASSPRFSLHEITGSQTFDVDHRWIIAA